MFTFDDYTSRAPHASPRWAASDRGWLTDELGDCRGTYLTYDAALGIPGASYVLASVSDRAMPGTGFGGTTHVRTQRFPTVADARAWMLAQLGATFIECGCCGAYHRSDYWGDCRNDAERFSDIPADAVIVDPLEATHAFLHAKPWLAVS